MTIKKKVHTKAYCLSGADRCSEVCLNCKRAWEEAQAKKQQREEGKSDA